MEERKSKGILTVIVMAVLYYGLAVMCYLKPDDEMSVSERRPLKQLPEVSVETLQTGEFGEEFEAYAMDQFPLRQGLRGTKVTYQSILMRKLDNNNLYLSNGYISKLDYPLDDESISYAVDKFEYIYDSYLDGKNVNIYLSIIPDKNYFNKSKIYPSYDYDELVGKMCKGMDYAEYIDIMNQLDMEDYYKTDSHLRQECLVDISYYLGKEMNVEIDTEYDIKLATDDFKGVYYSQFGMPIKGENMYYLTNETIEECIVSCEDSSSGITLPMYNLAAVNGNDPYELYLYGSQSIVNIYNKNAATAKELIVFRDSYGSSFAPMLATGYSKVTLVDIRYIRSDMLDKYMDFDNQDILFLYSTSLINNSKTLK